jgi:hypothetical protein
MAGNAAHGPGVFVVHFRVDRAATKGAVVFRWGDACAQPSGRIEERRRHAQRREDTRAGKRIERSAGDALDDRAEKDKAQIGVFDLGAGLVDERLGDHASEDAASSWLFPLQIEIAMTCQAGAVQ